MLNGAGRRAVFWLPPVLYMATIFYLSSQSDPLPTLTENVWDKALHTVEYAGLGLLVCRALAGEGLGWIRACVLAVIISGAYGATDEWHQAFTPSRSSDIHDWYTDNIGASLGAGTYAAGLTLLRRRVF
jgi:VanZ family protein